MSCLGASKCAQPNKWRTGKVLPTNLKARRKQLAKCFQGSAAPFQIPFESEVVGHLFVTGFSLESRMGAIDQSRLAIESVQPGRAHIGQAAGSASIESPEPAGICWTVASYSRALKSVVDAISPCKLVPRFLSRFKAQPGLRPGLFGKDNAQISRQNSGFTHPKHVNSNNPNPQTSPPQPKTTATTKRTQHHLGFSW